MHVFMGELGVLICCHHCNTFWGAINSIYGLFRVVCTKVRGFSETETEEGDVPEGTETKKW